MVHGSGSAADVSPSRTQWGLAEGEVGVGATSPETYILIANTSNVDGLVKVTLLFEASIAPKEKTFSVAPMSRLNVSVRDEFSVGGTKFGAIVESLGMTPAQIVVERAMYSDAGGVRWAAGTAAVATRLQ